MSDKDKAMIEVLLERMDKQRLPRLIDIREKLEQDQKLDSYDIEFLDNQPAVFENETVRHIRFDKPMQIMIDGKQNLGVVKKPGIVEKK